VFNVDFKNDKLVVKADQKSVEFFI